MQTEAPEWGWGLVFPSECSCQQDLAPVSGSAAPLSLAALLLQDPIKGLPQERRLLLAQERYSGEPVAVRCPLCRVALLLHMCLYQTHMAGLPVLVELLALNR